MRLVLLILTAGLASLGAWFWLQPAEKPVAAAEMVLAPAALKPAPGAGDESVMLREADSELSLDVGPRTEESPGGAPAEQVGPKIEWGALEIHGVLVDAKSKEPLGGQRLLLVPSGRKAGQAARCTTDAEGAFHFTELEETGPFDVMTWRGQRLGTMLAKNRDAVESVTLELTLGPTLVLLAELPPGVAATGLIYRIAQVSKGPPNRPPRPSRRNLDSARGVLDDEGRAVALFGATGEGVAAPAFELLVTTDDGLWALRSRIEKTLINGSEVEVEGAFEARGQVRVRLEIAGENAGGSAGTGAFGSVDWVLPMGDPQEPKNANGFRRGSWKSGADGAFMLTDLPIGPVELGQVRIEEEPAAGYVALNLVKAAAVHGEGGEVVIRMRRVGKH